MNFKKENQAILFNNQLTKFFKNDHKDKGIKDPVVYPVPDGDISFAFCKIKGKTRSM